MAEFSTETPRRLRNLRNWPRKAKKKIPTGVISQSRNWIDLPDDITALILSRLTMFDILERAQKVCLTWRRISKDPMTWRTIHMEFDCHLHQKEVRGEIEGNFTLVSNIRLDKREKKHLRRFLNFDIHKMCHHAIHISCGSLLNISIHNCGTDELLEEMTDSSRGIRRLSIVFSSCITMKGLSKVAAKLPLLEDLEISYTPRNGIYTNYYCCDYLKVIGRSCPVLMKSLKLNKHEGILVMEDNRDAFAIARTMHGLQNLQLFGNWLNFKGLHAILEVPVLSHLISVNVHIYFI